MSGSMSLMSVGDKTTGNVSSSPTHNDITGVCALICVSWSIMLLCALQTDSNVPPNA